MSSVKERSQTWCELFGVQRPIMNAPMADVADVELASAVSAYGGLGVLAADFMEPDKIVEAVAAIRAKTDRPFAVNLRAPVSGSEAKLKEFQEALSGIYEEFGIEGPWSMPVFEHQFEALLDAHVPVLSVTFGGLREVYAERCEALKIPVIGTATTLHEAKVLCSAGACSIVCQGQEAGGPRLNFEDEPDEAVGLLSLIGPVRRATGVPVVASGGISTGAQMAASLLAGASAVMLGTALVRTTESGASEVLREILQYTTDGSTELTEFFSGRVSRVLVSGLVDAMWEEGVICPAYPGALTVMRPIQLAARKRNRADLMELPCGFGASLAREGSVAEVLEHFFNECDATLREAL